MNEQTTQDREIAALADQYRREGYPFGNTPSGFARFVMDRVRAQNLEQKNALARRIAERESDPRVQRGR